MTLEQFLQDLFFLVLTAAIPLCLKFLYSWVTAFVEEKTQNMDNAQLKEYINSAVQAVMKAVMSTYQTYVDSLKKQDLFDEEAQKKAFEMAKNAALLMITEDVKAAVEEVYGDFNAWIDNTIEQFVKANKDGNVEATFLSLTS